MYQNNRKNGKFSETVLTERALYGNINTVTVLGNRLAEVVELVYGTSLENWRR